ncbi:MAG: ABC transporter substrate-binding protein [Nitrosopumilus sp.]|jgi:NitT/TauT family transport system substrate-binding protein|nr:ABC transporter substrate-binding protein [Nitrosopumilus sp.]MBT3573798.1 ABC transporter substrate-binding protein [Nitrosopumilus sp.]MBT3861788.1 ABC transporter substrate-binding protein [Nitrosopumilus sp.]MBT4298513.1 ABC transporter substrate-binding protein [Nitrosopumilus sp.]MBT4535060.1 ABC transporter substrate-binding protein [Nitrosopumilus sp.]
MTIKLILSVSIVVVIVGFIAGIILNSDESSNENTLRIAYFPNIGHAIPIIGMEKGFFTEQLTDTEIETRVFDSGPQVIESLFANSIDIAYVGPGPTINGFLNSENKNIQILSGAASGGASFIVHPNSEINTASDFAGKKIAVPQIGNTQDISLRHYLSENNLKPAEKGGSVIVYNISNPDIYTLFVKGDIDGAWVAEPWATILETELGGHRLFFEEDLWPDKQFASVLLIANTDYVEKNPEIISDFLISHHEIVKWINDNPVETRITFNTFLKSHLGQSLSDDVVDISLSNLEITSDPVMDSVYSFAEKANVLGYLGRNGYDLSGIFYNLGSNSNFEGDT